MQYFILETIANENYFLQKFYDFKRTIKNHAKIRKTFLIRAFLIVARPDSVPRCFDKYMYIINALVYPMVKE